MVLGVGAYIGCAFFLVTAFVTDIRSMKIPNNLSLSAIVIGLLYHCIGEGWNGFIFSGRGLVVGFGILLIFYSLGAVGGGDVKLFGGIGAWTGISFTLSTLMYSVVLAGCVGMMILLWRRQLFSRMRNLMRSVIGSIMLRSRSLWSFGEEGPLQFPFMIAVLPGAIINYLYW